MQSEGRFGLGREEIAERLDFLNFTSDDVELIHSVRPFLHSITDELAEDLYIHIRQIPSLADILKDHLTQCRIKQGAYLRQMLNATIDSCYTASRTWVGEVHRHMGVEPRWYLAAYYRLQELVAGRLEEHLADDPQRAWRIARSLGKLMVFDMILALDAFWETGKEVELQDRQTLWEHAAPVVLEVHPGVLVLPVSGQLDAGRVLQLEGAVLQAVARGDARALILELARLPELDLDTTRGLLALTHRWVSDLNLVVVLSGIRDAWRREIDRLGGLTSDSVVMVPRLVEAVSYVQDALKNTQP